MVNLDKVELERVIEKRAKECFGQEVSLKSTKRLLGGAQKYTCLATLTNGFKFVVYVWDKDTNYFSDSKSDIFLSSSAEVFLANNKLMKQHGIRTPEIYYIDKEFIEPIYALVEYIDGVDLDYILENQKDHLDKALNSLKEGIDVLHNVKSNQVGQVNKLLGKDFNPIEYCYREALNNIEYLTNIDQDSSKMYLKLNSILEDLASKIKKRSEFKFIHSELGPNHVMVDKDDNAYMIDIEGARFFDLEYEESFLKIRFDENYKYLKSDDLDGDRMKFYHICHCCGNLSGAYELLNKNYYDTEDIMGMINYFKKSIQELCL